VPRVPAPATVVLTNPDEDCSPAAFRAFLDKLLDYSEPEVDSLQAADTLCELRIDGQAWPSSCRDLRRGRSRDRRTDA
jgi:hypothetical protein